MQRHFHASAKSLRKYFDVSVTAKEASTPIAFYPQISMNLRRIPSPLVPKLCPYGPFSHDDFVQNAAGLHKFRESSVYWKQMAENVAVLEIKHTNGNVGHVLIPEWIDLHLGKGDSKGTFIDLWHGREKELSVDSIKPKEGKYPTFHSEDIMKTLISKGNVSPESQQFLKVSCVDPTHPLQSRQWGFVTRRIATYVKTLTEGNSLAVRLEGVGYRASLEPLKLAGAEGKKDALMFEDWIRHWLYLINKIPNRMYIAKEYPDSAWGKVARLSSWVRPSVSLYFQSMLLQNNIKYQQKTNLNEVSPYWIDNEADLPPLPSKLILKLGFTHDVELIVPPFIQVSMPNPTKIILSGVHANQVREFAYLIRKYRTPEPYKGKGVFVGSETIVLKQKKLK